MEESHQADICRVCRSEGTPDKPLYHPCICTGSIKYIHQECLVQWLKYSKKEFCELCKHKFTFKPIYSPDMPKRLPVKDIVSGLLNSVSKGVRFWLHYTLVAFAWLGVVPLTAYRIYKCLFSGSLASILTLPLDLLSPENIASDIFQGCFVVTCTLCAFISLIWLREQILHGGGPEWLEREVPAPPPRPNVVIPPPPDNGAVVQPNQPPAEPDVIQNAQDVEHENDAEQPANNFAQDDIWNPIDWERADELTWERLLGLDGSLVFLEHVFWVVSLNTLFIIIFAFLPYHIGLYAISALQIQKSIASVPWETLVTALFGYLLIGAMMIGSFTMLSICRLKRARRWVGLCYIVVKVSLLVVIEIGLFPLMSGWWLDICSLGMFDASWKDRMKSFNVAPGTSMFIHWLVGMVYIFYFASFILLLREVLRPGVLWFLRNLNDPDFNPIQEMIQLPVYRHIRRLIASMVIFGSTVLLMLWLPIYTIKNVFVGFLPYHVTLSADAPISELSLELLLLQVILPALLEQGNTRQWFKSLIRAWCVAVAWLLDVRSYLLGDQPTDTAAEPNDEQVNDDEIDNDEELDEGHEEDEDAQVAADARPQGQNLGQVNAQPPPIVQPVLPVAQGLAAAHHALLFVQGPTGFQPYQRPAWFTLRLVCLFALMCATLFVLSMLSCIVPVYVGRQLMSLWVKGSRVHELYTAGCGLYACWLTLRLLTLLSHWVPQGWNFIASKMKSWTLLMAKCTIIAALLLGLVPLMLGLLFELIVVIPLRVPLDQTPLFFLWQDWALGVLHAKIICAITLMGPQWWLKQVIEQVYNQGLWNIDLKFVLMKLCLPVIISLGLCLAVPYVIACGLIPACGFSFELQNLIWRRCYPFIIFLNSLVIFSILQVKQFHKLYEHIRNDKYLVGQKLVNFERRQEASAQ